MICFQKWVNHLIWLLINDVLMCNLLGSPGLGDIGRRSFLALLGHIALGSVIGEFFI